MAKTARFRLNRGCRNTFSCLHLLLFGVSMPRARSPEIFCSKVCRVFLKVNRWLLPAKLVVTERELRVAASATIAAAWHQMQRRLETPSSPFRLTVRATRARKARPTIRPKYDSHRRGARAAEPQKLFVFWASARKKQLPCSALMPHT